MRLLLGFLIILSCGMPQIGLAQRLHPHEYIYPLLNVKGEQAANFGEFRSNHFHSGIDIKTEGVEGKIAVAVAKGYVSRVQINPAGFGRAIYLTLDNGTTAVYGHMSRFRDDIEQYTRREQLRQQKNKIDLILPSLLFPVAQGDTIAFSGNSGTSYGPHLHFELRKSSSQRTLNLVQQGIFRPQDNIPPYILRIHYIETDTVRGAPIYRTPATYEATKIDNNSYQLTSPTFIPIGTNGYFVVETTDRRNGVDNTFGIYRATLTVDHEPLFEYRMNGFTFDHRRDCNAVAYYPIQIQTRNEAIRLASIDPKSTQHYISTKNRGVIKATSDQLRTLHLEIEDDCGNISRLEFTVCGRAPWRARIDSTATLCNHRSSTTLTTNGARLVIPPGALYESQLLTIKQSSQKPSAKNTIPILSPTYQLLAHTTPLKKAVEVTITTNIPEPLRPYATLGRYLPSGQIVYVGGRYKEGTVTTHTSSTGDMLIVADSIAPTITPLFTSGANLSHSKELTFRIGDNFSGIVSWRLTIDGTWALCDRLPIKGTAFHRFDTPPNGQRHHVIITLRDGLGNRARWEGWYIR